MDLLPIDEGKLNTLARQCRHTNVLPMSLPIYLHGQKKHPVTGPLSELVEELVQYLSLMNEYEIHIFVDNLPPGAKMFIDRDPALGRSASLERIALYYLIAKLQAKYLSFKDVIESDLDGSKILALYPELRSKLDKDGLLLLDESFGLMDVGIEYRDHVLHYHQFLRRGYSSNPNSDFTSRFINFYHQTHPGNRFRIAIDHHRVMPREFYQQIIELDTWFGPPFDPAELDDPNAVGFSVIKRNKDSLFGLTNDLERTEFFWSFRQGIKTLEIEEISNVGYQFDHYYLNRYVHSERNTQQRKLTHLDGAVKVYLQDSYNDRLRAHMPKQLKSHTKVKLFRIDGDIPLEDWINLISFFYKSNEMIIEYFNPAHFREVFEERVRDFKAWKAKQQGNPT